MCSRYATYPPHIRSGCVSQGLVASLQVTVLSYARSGGAGSSAGRVLACRQTPLVSTVVPGWFLTATSAMELCLFFFFQAEDGIRDLTVTGVQTCALPILELVPIRNAFDRRTVQGKLAQVIDEAGRFAHTEVSAAPNAGHILRIFLEGRHDGLDRKSVV